MRDLVRGDRFQTTPDVESLALGLIIFARVKEIADAGQVQRDTVAGQGNDCRDQVESEALPEWTMC